MFVQQSGNELVKLKQAEVKYPRGGAMMHIIYVSSLRGRDGLVEQLKNCVANNPHFSEACGSVIALQVPGGYFHHCWQSAHTVWMRLKKYE